MTIEKQSSPIEPGFANTSSLGDQILQNFKGSEGYRYSFIEEKIRTGLAAQIRAIRAQRGMDPKAFAESLGKKVSWVYRLEDPNAPVPTVPTLLQVARTLGVDLDVHFRSFSGLFGDLSRLSPSSFEVPSFEDELPDLERAVAQSTAFLDQGLGLWVARPNANPLRLPDNPYASKGEEPTDRQLTDTTQASAEGLLQFTGPRLIRIDEHPTFGKKNKTKPVKRGRHAGRGKHSRKQAAAV